jgi:hypothetical protein
MESYIKDRRIIVQCNNTKSRSRLIKAGVPQGSGLGSLLYIIFKNTIFQQHFNGKIQLYADDIAIVYTASSYSEMKRQMIADMLLIKEWMYSNKLEINAEKTKFLLFNTKNTNENLFDRLSVDEEEYFRVDSFELLGMKVDMKLNFSDHIQKVKSKIVPIIALIGRLRGHVRVEILKMLYFSHINSHLMYMLQVYRSAPDGRLKELYRIQKKVLKYILKVGRRFPTASIFNGGILSLPALIKYQDVLTIYKIKNFTNDMNRDLITFSNDTGRSRRINETVQSTIFPRLVVIRKSFFYAGTRTFNELPLDIQNIPTMYTYIHTARPGHLAFKSVD